MRTLISIAMSCMPGVVAVLGLALCTACSGAAPGSDIATTLAPATHGDPAADTPSPRPAPADLAGPPVDEYVDPAEIIARRGSVTGQFTRSGVDSFAGTSNCFPAGHNLLLEPGLENHAWAMYRFGEHVASDSPFVVSLELQFPLPDQLYIGVADYTHGAWNWQILDEPRTRTYFGLPGLFQPVSSGGNIHVTVLSQGESAVISSLTLFSETASPPPVNLRTATDGPYPDRIALNWDDPAVTYPGLSYILVYVERETADGSWLLLDYVPAGTVIYEDVSGEGNELPYNTDCHYRIRTNVYGDLSMAGPICTGRRVLRDVALLTATAGSYPDRINLAWPPVTEADSYLLEVNVDDAWHEVARLGAGETCAYEHVWDETPGATVPFDTPTEYRVSGLWQEYTSTGYATAIGRRGLGDAYHVEASAGTYPDQVLVSWGKVKDATGYEIGYGTSAGEIQSLAVLDGNANTEFTHTFETPVGKECALDTEYYYWVRGRFGSDVMPWDLDTWDTGYRTVNPPVGVEAADGDSPDEITIEWILIPACTGYEVYRDGMEPENLVAEVGATNTWTDPGTDYFEHEYRIRSIWQGEPSDFSRSDTGFRNLFRCHRLSYSAIGIPELAVIDGKPVIAVYLYQDGLTYWQSTTASPTSLDDWSSHYVYKKNYDPEYALAVIDGLPAIAAIDETGSGTELRFFQATDQHPANNYDWVSYVISDTAEPAIRPDLQEVDGLPALCFQDTVGRYAWATTTQPASLSDWTISDCPVEGFYPTLTDFQGKPVFTCSSDSNKYYDMPISFVRGLTSTPTTAEDWLSISLGESRPCYAVADVSDRLAMGYHQRTGEICYSRALVDEPSTIADWETITVASGIWSADIYGGEALVEFEGRPALCYLDGYDLYLARATVPEPTGDSDWEIFPVDKDVWKRRTLGVVNDDLVIVFSSGGALYYGVAQE